MAQLPCIGLSWPVTKPPFGSWYHNEFDTNKKVKMCGDTLWLVSWFSQVLKKKSTRRNPKHTPLEYRTVNFVAAHVQFGDLKDRLPQRIP